MGLIAPELMITWAARQSVSALIVAKIVNFLARPSHDGNRHTGDTVLRYFIAIFRNETYDRVKGVLAKRKASSLLQVSYMPYNND